MSRGWSANIDTRSYMAAMRILGKQVLPTVMADTLNGVAAANAKQMKKNVEKRMIVRTKFTTNSIRQDRHARGATFLGCSPVWVLSLHISPFMMRVV